MQLTHQRDEAAALSKFAAPSSDISTQADGGPNCTVEPARLASLRLQWARHGVSVASLGGQELLLSGAGFGSRAVPDLRCAVLLLRRLNGGL